jgi:hypothetical protein
LAQRLNQRCIVVSLRTRERKSARYLAAQLDATAEKMMASPPASGSQKLAEDFFRRSFAIHEEIIRRAASMPGSAPADIDVERRAAQDDGWTSRTIPEQGLPACVGDADRERMRAGGCSDPEIATVVDSVRWHSVPPRVAHMLRSIGQILVQVGVPDTADNVARVERLKHGDPLYSREQLPEMVFWPAPTRLAPYLRHEGQKGRDLESFQQRDHRAQSQ